MNFDIKPIKDLQPAATLMPVYFHEGEFHVIFTKRTDKVSHHKGQICFPGGMREQDDTSLWHTAVRETSEEINIPAHKIFYVETLERIITPTFFEITPYVGFVHCVEDLCPNPDEIDHIFTVPLSHLLDPKNLRFEKKEYFGKTYPVPFFRFENYDIWGATGRIVLTFLKSWDAGFSKNFPSFYQ